MKHIIGIDFGTSTSMIKVAVRDGSDSLETKPVTFTQYGIGSTPTLIRKKDGGVVWYGQDAAQNEHMDTVLYRNFKLGLKSEDSDKQQEAMELLEEFYRYLYKSYSEQKNFLIGADEGDVETVVSYPAQWGKEQQEAVVKAAKKAGFPNVSGMDEPTAAVVCVLKAKQKELEDADLLRAGKPLNILIVDMGAGTTDLAFVTATVENGSIQTNIRETWPKADSEHIYGGSQMDLRLETIMENWLTQSGIAPIMVQNLITGQRNSIKSWKESTLSALLEKGLAVDEFSAITNMLMMIGMPVNPFPSISKETFMDYFRPELESFVNVIASAPQNLRDETELVILTGGNSAWYWVRPVVLGINTKFGDVGLKNIRRISNRVLQMEQPADTVSRGLVYDKTHFSVKKAETHKTVEMPKKAGTLDTAKIQHTVSETVTSSRKPDCAITRKPLILVSLFVPPRSSIKKQLTFVKDCATLGLTANRRWLYIDGVEMSIEADDVPFGSTSSKRVIKDHWTPIPKAKGMQICGAGCIEVDPGRHTILIRSWRTGQQLMSCTVDLRENENLHINCATCEWRIENVPEI